MKFKKLIIAALSLVLILAMTSCGDINRIDGNKPTVVCTGFAQYDWVLNILGDEADNWNVIRINDKGADMHSYQPSAEDMIVISKADLLIYTGGMSEEWISDAMESQDFQGESYALLEKGEPICMEENHGHDGDDHGHDDDIGDHHGHNHDEYDEHIWLSLNNAKAFCEDITVLLDSINPSESYNENCQSYINKLEQLSQQYEKVLSCKEDHEYIEDHDHIDNHDHDYGGNTIIFADRFPFRYLAEDYELAWYAAFPGCSAETEASFDTIKELSNIVNEKNTTGVFVTETGDDSLAKTVIANSGINNIEIIRVNSMQSISKSETRGYLEIMEDNLEALQEVLK